MKLNRQVVMEHLLSGRSLEILEELLRDYKAQYLLVLHRPPSAATSNDRIRGRLDMLDDLLHLKETLLTQERIEQQEREHAEAAAAEGAEKSQMAESLGPGY